MSQMTLDGGEPPITQDPDYPPLIRELAEMLDKELRAVDIPPDRASAISEAAAEFIREHFGGQPLYWAKGETMRQRRRRQAMWRDFTGNNHRALSTKYGICLQQVYRQLAVCRAEEQASRQGRLALDEPATDGAA